METEIVLLFLAFLLCFAFCLWSQNFSVRPWYLLKCSVCVFFKALVKWIDDESCGESGATPKSSSEHVYLPKPVEAFKDWREWILRCIAVLEK